MNKKRPSPDHDYKILSKPVSNFTLSDSDIFLCCSQSFWHNGIHLENVREPLKTVYDGKIVACRYASAYKTKNFDLYNFKMSDIYLDSQDLSPGSPVIYNFFEEVDGKYQLKEDYKPETASNKNLRNIIIRMLDFGYSNSFMLIEHNVEKTVVLNNNSTQKINYTFYTLYNHLRPLNDYRNNEKLQLFFYSIKLQFNNTFPYSFVKGYATIDELQKQGSDYIQIPSETKLYPTDYYSWKLNNETKYGIVSGNYVRYLTDHFETKRPGSGNNYLGNGDYKTKTDKILIFDNQNKNWRCVIGEADNNYTFEINYFQLMSYLNTNNADIGLKVVYGSFTNAYIYFDKEDIEKITKGLKYYNIWNLENTTPVMTYSINTGFHYVRYTQKGQESFYLREGKDLPVIIPKIESHYILATKLKSDSSYDYETIEIPCELKLSQTKYTNKNFTKVSFTIDGKTHLCFISNNSIREVNNVFETKRKLRPYESVEGKNPSDYLAREERDITDKILIYDSDNISRRNVSATVPKNTKFGVSTSEFEKFITNKKYEQGLFVEYSSGTSKGSGYIYLPFGYDLSNIECYTKSNQKQLDEKFTNSLTKLNEWLSKLNQEEKFSTGEFSITLERNSKIKDDEIYQRNKDDSFINLPTGTIIGHSGIVVETATEKNEIEFFEEHVHFETFCFNNDFMTFNKDRTDYLADFKIKNEVSVHNKNPVTETIIKTLPLLNFNFRLKKLLFDVTNFKLPFMKAPELNNEALKMLYFKKTGDQVCLIDSEVFIEVEIQGKLQKLESNEYINRNHFQAGYEEITEDKETKAFYTVNDTIELNTYVINEETEEEQEGNPIVLYKDYRYEYMGRYTYKNRKNSASPFRKIKYIYVPIQNKEKFYISKKIFDEKLTPFNIETKTTYYLLEGQNKILQSEIFEKPTKLKWATPAETISAGTYENTHKEFTDNMNNTWIQGKLENSSTKIWINKKDIDDKIDTDKPVEEIIYDKWEDFFEELKINDYGKYRCEKKEDLLSQIGIENDDDIELKFLLNHNKEIVSSLYYQNNSEWKTDDGYLKEHENGWSDNKYLEQMCNDYCFWDKTNLKGTPYFFHPVKFLTMLDKVEIYNPAAKLLFDIQNVVVHLNNMLPRKENNNTGGIEGKQSGTFCNHATYLIIRAFDEEYLRFTKNHFGVPTWGDIKKESRLRTYSDDYEKNGLRSSNYWCDVLEYQSKNSDETGIHKLQNLQEAQKKANMGYVVIAAWKNKTKGGSPHYATLAPNVFCKEKNEPVFANVGGTCQFTTLQGASNIPGAFGNKSDIKYYYNEKQIPRIDLEEALSIDEGWGISLAEMIKTHGKWSNSNDIWEKYL